MKYFVTFDIVKKLEEKRFIEKDIKIKRHSKYFTK